VPSGGSEWAWLCGSCDLHGHHWHSVGRICCQLRTWKVWLLWWVFRPVKSNFYWHSLNEYKCSWSASTTQGAYLLDTILVEVVHILNCSGLINWFTPLTEFGENIPPRVTHLSEQLQPRFLRTGPSRPLKRTFAMLGMLFTNFYHLVRDSSHLNWKTSLQGPLQRTGQPHVTMTSKLCLSYWHSSMPTCDLVLQTPSFQSSSLSVDVGWSPREGFSLTTNVLQTLQLTIQSK